jgi:hypothetical protein
MFRRTLIAAAIAFSNTGTTLAEDAQLAKIREEIRQMKESYEQRINALERRLAEAEAKTVNTQSQSPQSAATATPAATARPGRTTRENAFNPSVSLILQGTYASTSQDPDNYQITGFIPSGGEVGPPKRSFGLAETELNFSANIDPYFRGVAIAALTPENEVEVEEAYFQTLALPRGFTLKGGRFFSGIGYQNEIHQHAWDFQDVSLPAKAFLAGRLRQDGVQARWLAPTDLFLELGTELSSGDQYPGSDRNKNGVGGSALFAHLGGDIGTDYAWRAGLSYLRMTPENRAYDDLDALGNPVTNSLTGRAKLWVADAVLKWAPNGNSSRTHFKLQAEYFHLRQNGRITYDDTAAGGPFGVLTDGFDARQSGWYAQGVWQFMPRWRVGYRYDTLRFGDINNGIVANGLGPTAADFPVLASHSPTRHTAMLDWSLTEFSRFRLQVAADKSRQGVTDNQVILQYIHSLGAHGAHRF